tara:strand:+ start:31300 stop:31431 length:132 start_codon:yes stop_codon:yes gene_type:complete
MKVVLLHVREVLLLKTALSNGGQRAIFIHEYAVRGTVRIVKLP